MRKTGKVSEYVQVVLKNDALLKEKHDEKIFNVSKDNVRVER